MRRTWAEYCRCLAIAIDTSLHQLACSKIYRKRRNYRNFENQSELLLKRMKIFSRNNSLELRTISSKKWIFWSNFKFPIIYGQDLRFEANRKNNKLYFIFVIWSRYYILITLARPNYEILYVEFVGSFACFEIFQGLFVNFGEHRNGQIKLGSDSVSDFFMDSLGTNHRIRPHIPDFHLYH